ncbi:MAG TPA: AAA family ATPase [Anaeromyxobacteraceae bacterium]|nr:AAA family ATPase [Anaeromyxobacteraceae bacterium]
MDPAPQPEPAAAPPGRDRIVALLAALEDGLVERRTAVRLAVLAALAGEHTLLVGPPGTAKSELARRLHLAFAGGRYFERLLTRFTVPEELFGPLSISALEQDRYERQTAGFLPDATIAFVDEVFKGSSAILNALLTLLHEREFDNGPRRERCPLISVIGATNAVPDDELGEAFLDRFLVRLPVAPVAAEAFPALLATAARARGSFPGALREEERRALSRAADGVRLGEEVAGLLGEARARLAGEGLYVSDRRWVKIVRLLCAAAAGEGRSEVAIWDLWLLPWCTAADGRRQASVASWLAARLGVREALAPPRLTRVVEAFEAQVEAEHAASDLDYDQEGRIRLDAALAAEVADAKGASAVPRMATARRRRYGEAHVAARLAQLDDLVRRIDRYAEELSGRRQELAAYLRQAVWIDAAFAREAGEALGATVEAVGVLRQRALAARGRFAALPRLEGAQGSAPEPVAHEPLGA